MWVYFLRHGQSEANVAGVISDDPARPHALTPLGIRQAEQAAVALADVPFARIYVSEHRRTQQTAAVLLSHWRAAGVAWAATLAPPRVEARLNERYSGMDGQPVHHFDDWVGPDPVRRRPPGGESFLEQMDRLRGFMAALAADLADAAPGPVLAVSHENPILAAQAVAGLDPEQAARGRVANCGWVKVAWPVR